MGGRNEVWNYFCVRFHFNFKYLLTFRFRWYEPDAQEAEEDGPSGPRKTAAEEDELLRRSAAHARGGIRAPDAQRRGGVRAEAGTYLITCLIFILNIF